MTAAVDAGAALPLYFPPLHVPVHAGGRTNAWRKNVISKGFKLRVVPKAAPKTVEGDAVYVNVLSRRNMGVLLYEKGPKLPGEHFLKGLVSKPHLYIPKLLQCPVEAWLYQEKKLVAAMLAAGNDRAARNVVKKEIPALVPARFDETMIRDGKHVLGRQVIGHDFDQLVADCWESVVSQVQVLLPDRFLAMHTTASERGADTWKLRVYELLDREATPAQWNAHVKTHMRALGEHDSQALDVVRLLYMPIRTAGYRFAIVEGARTKLDDLLALPVDGAPSKAPAEAPSAEPSTTKEEVPLLRTAAKLLAEHLPAAGARSSARLALSGALWHQGYNEAESAAFLQLVHEFVPDRGDQTDVERSRLRRRGCCSRA